jgi:hypothetical protein
MSRKRFYLLPLHCSRFTGWKTDTPGDNPANRTLIINWGVMENIQGRLSTPPNPPGRTAMRAVGCVRYGTISRLLPNFSDPKSCRFAGRKAAMENYRVDELRAELGQLLKKQAEVLESRSLGAATDTDLLEYEIRQEIVHEICNQLAHSISE